MRLVAVRGSTVLGCGQRGRCESHGNPDRGRPGAELAGVDLWSTREQEAASDRYGHWLGTPTALTLSFRNHYPENKHIDATPHLDPVDEADDHLYYCCKQTEISNDRQY